MGSDDLFKKKREERKKRNYGYRQPRANSFLIVTEGERTEPLYFKEMQMRIKNKMGGSIDIYEMPIIEISGEGCSTTSLIEKADELVSKARLIYQNVWIVFDKDDFSDFDSAIKEGENRGYHIAWSNQSFEYWLFLHFEYSDSALHRNEWNDKLTGLFKKYGLGKEEYHKNNERIYQMVDSYGGVNLAIKNAKRRMSGFNQSNCKPSEYDPGTTVHLLIEDLKKFLDE